DRAGGRQEAAEGHAGGRRLPEEPGGALRGADRGADRGDPGAQGRGARPGEGEAGAQGAASGRPAGGQPGSGRPPSASRGLRLRARSGTVVAPELRGEATASDAGPRRGRAATQASAASAVSAAKE